MKKILPVILILLGVAEIAIASMDVKPPLAVAAVVSVILIALGVRTLLDAVKRK